MVDTRHPNHVLILGSGVFALTTALEILSRPSFSHTKITLVSPTLPLDLSSSSAAQDKSTFPAHLTSSHDTTRIIRTDYADAAYAALGAEAHAAWRDPSTGWGADGRYTESGLVLCSDAGVSTEDYVRKALANARDLEKKAGVPDGQSKVHDLTSAAAIAAAMNATGAAKGTGDSGYLNTGAGWADAGACTQHLQALVLGHPSAPARLTPIRAAATRLTFTADENPRIAGAALDRAPHAVAADLTVLATGAWTPTLLDTRGAASPRAQASAYVSVSDAEAEALKAIPVHLNLGTGCFVFPPTRTAARHGGAPAGWEVKMARHAFGYVPPSKRARPVRVDGDGEKVVGVAGVPTPTFADRLPPADEELMRRFLAEAVPLLADVADAGSCARAFTPRLCYYLDTAEGEWLVTRHPAFRDSLFVATGGSGHAFKFMPALGRRVVDVLEGVDRAGWARRWRWPEREAPLRRWEAGEVWCRDGSRAGEPGQRLEDALAGQRTVEETAQFTPGNPLDEAFRLQQEQDPSKFKHKSNL